MHRSSEKGLYLSVSTGIRFDTSFKEKETGKGEVSLNRKEKENVVVEDVQREQGDQPILPKSNRRHNRV